MCMRGARCFALLAEGHDLKQAVLDLACYVLRDKSYSEFTEDRSKRLLTVKPLTDYCLSLIKF